jgi:polyisoprenoid-binding protein YceI
MSTTKWVIDPTHSEIGFKVKHMILMFLESLMLLKRQIENDENILKLQKLNLSTE